MSYDLRLYQGIAIGLRRLAMTTGAVAIIVLHFAFDPAGPPKPGARAA